MLGVINLETNSPQKKNIYDKEMIPGCNETSYEIESLCITTDGLEEISTELVSDEDKHSYGNEFYHSEEGSERWSSFSEDEHNHVDNNDFVKYVLEEEENWDDDSDDYWDPSVRAVPWLSSHAFYKHSQTKVNTEPISVVEGQFDDAVEDVCRS